MSITFLGGGAGGSGIPPPTKPPFLNRPTPAPALDLTDDEDEDEEQKKAKYRKLEPSPMKPCGTRPLPELEPQASRIFPIGGPEAIVTDPSLPLHPNNRWIGRERCTRDAVRESYREILEVESRLRDLAAEHTALSELYDDAHENYMHIVDTTPKNSEANAKTLDNAYRRYQQRTNDLMFNMVTSRVNYQRMNRRLQELLNTYEAQRVGWGYHRLHPTHEFIVVLANNIPIVQRTQPLNARLPNRNRNNDNANNDNNDPSNNKIHPKGPRDRRSIKENCTIVPYFTLNYLSDLADPELAPGIYVFNDKNVRLSDKMEYLTNVYSMIKKTLHAWHDSWFYTKLHDKMNAAFLEFTAVLKNEDFSTYKKKLLAMTSVINHLVGFMDEHYTWYAYPEDVPEKITTIIHNAQNNL